MRPSDDIEGAIRLYGDTVWRVCALYFGQGQDSHDAYQDTFLKYALHDDAFNDDEHVKAWLIRVATNICKDMLKASSRSTSSIDDEHVGQLAASLDPDSTHSTTREVLEAMWKLTDPPRTPVYLALYEGYTAVEIAEMMDKPLNTVYSWITRGRNKLKEALS